MGDTKWFGIAMLALLAAVPARAASTDAVPSSCFGDATFGTWSLSCQKRNDDTFCLLQTGDTHGGWRIMTRKKGAADGPPEARLIFATDQLSLNPNDRKSISYQFGREPPQATSGRAISPTSLVVAMDFPALVFWIASGKDPDTMKFSIDGQDHLVTFPHHDFVAALNRMLVCNGGKDDTDQK